eukprot:CAMPEP_0202707986 /NCGR_PEP_ID=MMETSP1385-20130828/20255_1 /ASSEMBLY_ACC=CAM_ASM_000861 /TAXON_ID=933848 /ORGANISM="Elphidium margaritaceum" /LENGTH=385 /DNA_ID=CAMNT_0049366847 /DNA_START=58 /DNA_END=1215 /DNA_ORIENTATION=+
MASDEKQNDDEKKMDSGTVLVMGGCGFIGRHLVQYLAMNAPNMMIVVADKLLPQTSYMTQAMITLFTKSDNIKVVHSDLSKDHHIKKIFVDLGYDYDYIINLCGETRFGQSDQDYQIKCIDSCKKCMIAASACKNLKKWIEVSTAQVYEPAKNPLNEKAKIAPFTKLANFRLQCEQLIEKSGFPYVILRPSIVYGPGDKTGLTPRLVCAACYKHKGEKMDFLWTKNLAINTVHVRDLCSAIWICCLKSKAGAVYNVSDEGHTTQGSLNPMLEKLFNISCGFKSTVVNSLAKNTMSSVAAYSNDKHVPMWSDLCRDFDLGSSPLTPYIDMEILSKNYLYIDGTRICKELGFQYKYKQLDIPYLQEIVDEYVQQRYLPDLNSMGKKK